jgi:hypothetical protein
MSKNAQACKTSLIPARSRRQENHGELRAIHGIMSFGGDIGPLAQTAAAAERFNQAARDALW